MRASNPQRICVCIMICVSIVREGGREREKVCVYIEAHQAMATEEEGT